MAEYNNKDDNSINRTTKDRYITLKQPNKTIPTISLEEYQKKEKWEKDSDKLVKADIAIRTLRKYGIIIPKYVLEDEKKVEMLNTAVFSNPTNNSVRISIDSETYTISLFDKMAGTTINSSRFNQYYVACCKQESTETPFIVERFKSFTPHYDIQEALKNAISTMQDPNTRLLSRAYTDVETKYGPFCIFIEEDYKTEGKESYRKVSIYYGNHSQVLNQRNNLFDEESGNILNWHYDLETTEEYFNFGLYNYSRDDSTRRGPEDIDNRTQIEILPTQKNETSIYFAKKKDKKENNNRYYYITIVPTPIDDSQLLETIYNKHSNIEGIFKGEAPTILIGHYDPYIISKKLEGDKIILELSTRKSTQQLSYHPITTFGEEKTFTKDDILTIINHCNDDIHRNPDFNEFIIGQLVFYITTHDEYNLSNLKPGLSLREQDFESAIDELTQYSYEEYVEIVEKSLENLASSLCISIETLLDGCEKMPIENGTPFKKTRK